MAESVQDQGVSAGMSELSKEHAGAVGSRSVRKAKPAAVTQFRGVRLKPSGRYGARIWVPSLRGNVCLGTFDTAEEAAKAYDAAACELFASTPGWAEKKKKKTAAAVEPHACTPGWAAKKKRAAARPDAWTGFRGVYRMRNGKYGAQIRNSRGKPRTWLGTFDAAEDAARAFDQAAVKIHGAMAVTNFKQPKEDKDDAAETMAAKKKVVARSDATADDGDEESSMDLLNDFPEMPPLELLSHSFISGAQLDDLSASLPPSKVDQIVDEFLNDTDFSDVAP